VSFQNDAHAVKQRIRQVWLSLLISGLFLLWWSEFSDWGYRFEFWVSQHFYEKGVGFPLKDSASFEFWWHKFPKYVVYALPVWALANIVYGFFKRDNLDKARRTEWHRWLAIFFVGLLVPLLLSLLKKWTNQACPWSLTDFGGTLPYVHLLDPRPWVARSQACWPAGHAAVGLSLLVVTFVGGFPRAVWQDTAKWNMPRSIWLSARAFALYALVLSMALGFSQVMRGAHFISHQFWSLWIVLVFLMLFVQIGLIKPRWWNLNHATK
jgi:membrane-associated PAP2 superfamily phosphatase